MQAAPPIAPIALLATAGFLSVAGMRMTDPLLHVIASDLGTTVPALAVVVAAFTLPYGLCQIVLGPLGDRFGKLRVMAGALALLTLANIACALSGTVQGLTLARIAAGGASAAVVPLGMAYVADAVEYRERQVMLSRYLNGTVLAQVMAGPLGGVFGQFLGWRGVFLVLAAGTAAIAVVLGTRLAGLWGLVCLFAGNMVFIYATLLAAYRRGYYDLVKYALLAPVYWLLMSIGAWKGSIQLITRPNYWEKTRHGFDLKAGYVEPTTPGEGKAT